MSQITVTNQRNFEDNMSNFVITTVPADGLAPLDARSYAGTVMTKFWSRIYTEPVFETSRLRKR